MPLPHPEPGLIISYAYLWFSEHERGREEGLKNRPCVIVLAVREQDGQTIITVAPVTHSPPSSLADAVEIPLITKRRLGLDEGRSWVVASEVNHFAWPGPDMRPIAPDRFDYGLLPPSLFRQIRDRILSAAAQQRLKTVRRTE